MIDDKFDYNKAKKAWNYYIDTSNGNMQFYKIIMILSVISIITNTALYIDRISKPQFYPYYVYLTGTENVEFKGKITNTILTITGAAIREHLIRFVSNMRTISTDVVVLKKNYADCFYLATKDTQRQLIQDLDMFNNFEAARGGKRRDVEFTSFVRIAENRWKVDWNESVREGTKLVETVPMTGTFPYIRGAAVTDIEAEKNSVGIYFSEYYIKRGDK